ncbi:UvrD-helicase domain-containing protein [Paenibacillus sp. GSMTC-2017]|uniref:RNA polymerase recycling motor HelD n=1 Tax=Paenibacillus sp. GSMTC-2017 TaxID=2794350 RepID=UPI0018D6C870|nr:RNA polymerase recycling motor HelD [Paenibacillus sp. GSMTC-2017]MBH5318107.1 UvrD-helicase domain-containing protein [Paenibacillus sp. GSMTC-2017]
MSSTTTEWQEEQLRVVELNKVITKRISFLQDQMSGSRSEIVDVRKNFWDDVTVNFEDAAEEAETFASMKQQAEILSERERSFRHMEQQLATLLRLQQSPYFGRIDIKEDGSPKSDCESIYLGIGSMLDDSGENYLIYDWRAPVSSLYYDYGPGPVKYETPGGEVRGEMTLKRQYIIREAQIKSMFDTGVTIGDELLQEVLGRQSDAQMKSIVATIQQEQNRIIRNEKAKLLIVQGAAGSGKTSAALQRVAYLLYRYRGLLQANQIVLFSPNPMFNSYVSTVLPELGEQNMAQTTYQQYLEHRLIRDFALEDPFTQMEYTLTSHDEANYKARMDGISYKSEVAFMELMDAYTVALGHSGLLFSSIIFRGRAIIKKDLIAEQFYQMDSKVSIPNRLNELTKWLLKELTRLSKLEREKKWVDDEIELMDQDAYVHAFQELRKKNKFTESSFDDYRAERDFLAVEIVQEKFKTIRKRVKQGKFLNVPAIYKALFQGKGQVQSLVKQSTNLAIELPTNWGAISDVTLSSLEAGIMPYEDATPYLYLKEKLEGFQTNTTVKHLFIDEAQDYSAFQYHYLKKIFPNCKMTVLGDYNQSIFTHSGSGNIFHALSQLYDTSETEKIVLSRSYRSTRQIVQFTSKMIQGGDQIQSFNRDGAEPAITKFDHEAGLINKVGEQMNEWITSGYESVALICKTAEEAKKISLQLQAICPEMRLIEQETVTFQKGIVVIPSYLAKGVEFDAVIICNASSEVYSLESERKLFYTACTRAMHELHLYYTGELTPFLE